MTSATSTGYSPFSGRRFQHIAEFYNYLGHLIVTAAVYRGFNSGLAPLFLTFRHRAGVSPYTSAFALAETCVFSKQSVGPFLCGPQQLTERKRRITTRGSPSPEVTGTFCRVP
jgi:hypothetical protein